MSTAIRPASLRSKLVGTAIDALWSAVTMEAAERATGISIHRYDQGVVAERTDEIVIEEPFEIQIAGRSIAMIMRTPGHDHYLAAGFLYAEGIVHAAEDFRAARFALDHNGFPQGNVIDLRLRPELEDAERLHSRHFLATASCGLCGKASIESAQVRIDPLADAAIISTPVLLGLNEKLREAQAIFRRTGGLHAAGLFDLAGNLLAVHEDIGRHNAVDKVIGQLLLARGLPLHDTVLLVSGRASFELVQKAALAGIPILAAISAPSSLAVELARASRLTVIGLLRPGRFVVYSYPERIRP